MRYQARVVDAELQQRLAAAGAVVIEGAKACGKTATASRVVASQVMLDIDTRARQAVAIDPSLVLEGQRPRLLDEWQVEPRLWNHVRRAVDAAGAAGQFVLTGSAVPADDADRHSGAGRFSFLRMRPMTLFESGHSTAAVSLAGLFDGEPVRAAEPDLSLRTLIERIVIGGWPAQQNRSVSDAARAARDYLEQVRQVDISRVGGIRRDPARVGALLASLARNVATEVKNSVLAADAAGADGALDEHTVAGYLDALQQLMVIEDQRAWAPHLRSKAVLRKSPKRHFVDPSLAVAALTAGPDRLLADLNLLGLLFESLVVRDLRVLSQPLDGQVLHYRDHYGIEVDTIVQLADGRWGAFEVKLGDGMVEQGAQNLRRFVQQIDLDRAGQPAVLAVICGTGYGYVRDDGVAVVPIGTLAP
ncbi:MAG: DUF4143 domain-containing protein [Nitriliruptoraceae bacterium]